MNNYYDLIGNPIYRESYQQSNPENPEQWRGYHQPAPLQQVPAQQLPPIQQLPATPNTQWPAAPVNPLTDKKGNVCAFVSDEPVTYNKLNITHWPSQDYIKPHPKGFLHTLHQQQYPGQYVPYK